MWSPMGALGVGLLLVPHPAAAQQLPLGSGERVRITAPALGLLRVAGDLASVDDSTVRMTTADTSLTVTMRLVERFERYAGRHNHPWRGAAIGALGGAVVGGAIGWVACENYTVGTDGNCLDSREGAQIIMPASIGIGAVGGSLIGMAIGAAVQTDKWTSVPLDDLRISIVPQRDGRITVAASIRP